MELEIDISALTEGGSGIKKLDCKLVNTNPVDTLRKTYSMRLMVVMNDLKI